MSKLFMGCMGSILCLSLSIVCSYLSMRYGWGIEVKSWPFYVAFGVVGQTVLVLMGTAFSQVCKPDK